jgi:tungstate transport system substrate-binding protein
MSMTIQRRRLLQAAGAAGVAEAVGAAGCLGEDRTRARAEGAVGDGELVLATTTSTYDSGLLDELNPAFRQAFGVAVKTLSKGTGAALRTARDGDADVVLVHARDAENEFLRDGDGVNRRDVMFNDFVVVGPADDPAGIGGMASAAEAFSTVAEAEATFLSRGDDSGTHEKERAVWRAAGVEPGGSWYRLTGQGMGNTLTQADQVGGYTLADRGTYLATATELDLAIHVQGPMEGGPAILKNPYGVIPVNPARHEHVNYQAAMAYVGFLTGPDGQAVIDSYRKNGERLFHPSALSSDPEFDQYVPEGG